MCPTGGRHIGGNSSGFPACFGGFLHHFCFFLSIILCYASVVSEQEMRVDVASRMTTKVGIINVIPGRCEVSSTTPLLAVRSFANTSAAQ